MRGQKKRCVKLPLYEDKEETEQEDGQFDGSASQNKEKRSDEVCVRVYRGHSYTSLTHLIDDSS